MIPGHPVRQPGWEGAMLEMGTGGLDGGRRREGAVSRAEIAAVVIAAIVVLALVW